MNIHKNTSIEVFFFYMAYLSDKEIVKYETNQTYRKPN